MNQYRGNIRVLWQWLPLWLLISFVAAGVTYSVLARRGPTYSVHFSYLVSLAEREVSAEYTFDGFYALQAIDLFTTTLTEWIQAPELLVKAYEAAGIALPVQDARRLQRSVVATKKAPQLIEVVVSGRDAATAERLAAALVVVTNRNVEVYHEEGAPALQFGVVATEPWTSVVRPTIPIVVGSVFVITLVLLINGQLVWTAGGYARRD